MATRSTHTHYFENFSPLDLSYGFIIKHSHGTADTGAKGYYDIQPEKIAVNTGVFNLHLYPVSYQVSLALNDRTLIITCSCRDSSRLLCTHATQVLLNISNRDELRIFFDEQHRQAALTTHAKDYGLENEKDLQNFFEVGYVDKSLLITSKIKGLVPVTNSRNTLFKDQLLPVINKIPAYKTGIKPGTNTVLIFKQHKYYKHFQAELAEAETAKNGKLKNPLITLDPLSFVWKTQDPAELKFYTAILKFQHTFETGSFETDQAGLNALVANPLNFPVFFHDAKIAESITAASLVPVRLKTLQADVRIQVEEKNDFYEISSQFYLDQIPYDINNLQVKFGYFIHYYGVLHFINNPDYLRVIEFFRKHQNLLVIHRSKFEAFRQEILDKLENNVAITYTYLKPATQQQLTESGFDEGTEKIVYLSNVDDFIRITPVMRYGKVEVPLLSKRKIYAIDPHGRPFTVSRNEAEEIKFLGTVMRQHPYFEEQVQGDEFYLHKSRFMDEGWFLNAFEEWQDQQVTILGFNALKNNNLNPHKVKISIRVNSGLDWFETSVKVYYGKQKVPLKHLQRSIRNRHQFIRLDDGTLGVLPGEWIEKFTRYFRAAEVAGDTLRTPKINFSGIREIYEEEVLSEEVKLQLEQYQQRISSFDTIKAVEVPRELKGTLRDYQKQGLNWLNFLDEFGFGGCLADDMGLGKTIQVIAFILSQRGKDHANTNLVVVPATLIFNWQDEIARFAPSIKIHTVYGADRVTDTRSFDKYEVILTSYGTLLNDIRFLKQYKFNYIFLDESQIIKNPDSLRYQAACSLHSRNRVVMTGTPVENNTYDLYGQLSFACPGLLGSKRFFRDHYATPIDQFKDTKRAIQLQRKVSPFILRRTKKQVATELPDKTEVIMYCEMGESQRKVYDTYKEEYRDFLLSKPEEELSKFSMHILKGLTLLRQICDSPALLKADRYYGSSSSKIQALLDEIESRSGEHKILVFSQFVTMLDLVKKELHARTIPFEYLTGQTRKRAEKVANFRENKDVRVFLISLKAGGTGLNLTEADYVYLIDPWWNPAVENQAIDRSYRIGQEKQVVAVRLICPDTIEEKIMKLQQTKKQLVNELVKTDTEMIKALSRNDLLSLFS
ncbi:DEAD/DEAH box helicase [Hufsiella ginkgonis]|uniref:DEAD/DEAH box helicase n=1 Tax=Hufsiella ginkgonis TaxID=2695274 RepID=UPI001929239A|nr:DEAD/DEAH box helicase [Hufsiella ginkgonis]